MIVLDVGQLGGEYAKAAGGHRRGKGDESWLIHAKVVHAMQHHQRGRIRMAHGGIEPPPHRSLASVEGYIVRDDRLCNQLVQHGRNRLVPDEVQYGDRLQVRLRERPDKHDDHASKQE